MKCDRTVRINEIVMSVEITLADSSPVRCTNSDASRDGKITAEELIQSVNHALTGCSEP